MTISTIKRLSLQILSITLLSGLLPLGATAQTRIIFDTDMGNDVDDALALAMVHAFTSRGEAQLLAVTTTKDNRWVAPYIDIVDTFYGRPDIPIGVVKNGKTPKDSPMISIPAQRRRPNGTPVYPHRLLDGRNAPEAVAVLRRILSQQPDDSVTIVQIGFSTNLARLVQTDRELIARKVHLLSMMAGDFSGGGPEYNIRIDIPAAKQLFDNWPTPIVISGYEVGKTILYPARSIEHDFSYAADHPIAEAYRNYQKMPYDRPTWDLTALLYAVRPDRNYFTLSDPGTVRVDDKGDTLFTANPAGRHRYLKVNDIQRARILEAFEAFASEPPDHRRVGATH